MVQSCVVVGCTNRWEKGSKLSWHRIPGEKHGERRKKWMCAINRKNWVPGKQDRVCGKHFLTGCVSLNPYDPDFVPSLYMGYPMHQTSTPDGKLNRFSRVLERQRRKSEREQDENDRQAAASVLMDLSNFMNCSDSSCDADTEVTPPQEYLLQGEADSTAEDFAQMKLENQAMMQELQQLQEEKRWLQNNLKERTFGVSFLKQGNSDKKTGFFTGIPNFQTFIWIVSFVQDSIPAFSAVTPGDAVLLVLMKLRLNLQNYDLALRFNISQTTVSEILNRTIPALADKLKCFIHWPEKEEVIRHLPKLFKPKYKNARTIIDCTEIFIDRPGNLTVRASTWSNYKHHNTIKYLVAISPVGAISFLSRAFGGRTSDKVVTQRSGFLDLLEHGDLILADRGFLISEEIAARGCYLAIPAFTKGQTQLSQREVESSRHMSRVRIHVERAIGRLKTFKILSTQMSLSLVPHCDSIVTICSAICNLQPKLVK